MTFKTLDVAIGIAFLYLLLTFVASAFVELLSTVRKWRARMLRDAINNMLSGSALVSPDALYKDPLILSLSRSTTARAWFDLADSRGWQVADGKSMWPAYIPAGTFSAAIIHLLTAPTDNSPDLAVAAISTKVSNQPGSSDPLASVIRAALATQGQSIQAVRLSVEKWFNDAMDRTSGWYKRRTQSCLLIVGLAMAFGANVDTIAVVRWLWQGDAARQAIIAAATDYTRTVSSSPGNQVARPAANAADGTKLGPAADPNSAKARNDSASTAATSVPLSSAADPSAALANIASQIVSVDRSVSSLQYPLGWPPATLSVAWLLQYLVGALITAIAISMGSTFWFDAVQSLLKIRGTGPKPGTR